MLWRPGVSNMRPVGLRFDPWSLIIRIYVEIVVIFSGNVTFSSHIFNSWVVLTLFQSEPLKILTLLMKSHQTAELVSAPQFFILVVPSADFPTMTSTLPTFLLTLRTGCQRWFSKPNQRSGLFKQTENLMILQLVFDFLATKITNLTENTRSPWEDKCAPMILQSSHCWVLHPRMVVVVCWLRFSFFFFELARS